MIESASKMLNGFAEFCRERSDILMISGVALVILIILFAIIKAATKKDDDDDEDFEFDENDFKSDKLYDQIDEEEQSRLSDKAEKADVATENTVISKQKIKETIGGDRIESLLEEIAGIPTKNLEEVEIKIQGAELKFKYAKNDFTVINESKQEKNDKIIADEDKESDSGVQAYEQDGAKKDDFADTDMNINPNAEDEEERIVVKKFGPDNVDTSRSGRVFTEDELEEQIRD